jgi:rod shape-determining protein MreC
MQKLLSKKKVVIGAVVLLFLFSLNLVSAQARGFAISVSSPFQAALWRAGDEVSTFFAGGMLRKENELLYEENLALLQKTIALQDIARENTELRSILNFELQDEFQLEMAEIIGKNIAEDVITIRKGTINGIQVGMPVITSSRVAVGRVVEVFKEYAYVELLSAKDKKLDAKISDTPVTGVVEGQGGARIILDLVPQEEQFAPGDIVVTSALGNSFPENILIGRVNEVIKTGADPFQKADLQPFFSLKTTEFVLIITSFL